MVCRRVGWLVLDWIGVRLTAEDAGAYDEDGRRSGRLEGRGHSWMDSMDGIGLEVGEQDI